MIREQWCDDTDRGTPKNWEKNPSHCHFNKLHGSNNPESDNPPLKSGIRLWKVVRGELLYRTAGRGNVSRAERYRVGPSQLIAISSDLRPPFSAVMIVKFLYFSHCFPLVLRI
jgi:hypothetical protein